MISKLEENLCFESDVRFYNFKGFNLISHAQAGIGITANYALIGT